MIWGEKITEGQTRKGGELQPNDWLHDIAMKSVNKGDDIRKHE